MKMYMDKCNLDSCTNYIKNNGADYLNNCSQGEIEDELLREVRNSITVHREYWVDVMGVCAVFSYPVDQDTGERVVFVKFFVEPEKLKNRNMISEELEIGEDV